MSNKNKFTQIEQITLGSSNNSNKHDYDYLFKFIVIGDSYTGKSALVMRFADDTFTDSYISTIGIDFKIRIIESNNKFIKLQIWDCAGQERFRSIVTSYYKGANSVVITYSISNRKSFTNVINWYNDCKKYCNKDINIILVGTKSDLDKKREVLFSEGEKLAKELGLEFFETSSKYDTNIDKAFDNLTQQTLSTYLEKNASANKANKANQPNSIKLDSNKNIKFNFCCYF